MALAPLTKANFDSPNDNPQLARGELASNVDKTNAVISAQGAVAPLNVGTGLVSEGGNLVNRVGTNPLLRFHGGALPTA